ncbi:MAG: sigma-70 family RNA polymerase sigma factor [Planctomycetes bacterium]|nr:sigma-70 family RNA polymerase sigma factor [Planctomycetota bacterium]
MIESAVAMGTTGKGASRSAVTDNERHQKLSQLWDRYARRLHAYACVLARSPSDAEDALQECFLHASERIERLADVRDAERYLFAMLRNECLRGRRRWSRWWKHDAAVGAFRLEAADEAAAADAGLVAADIERAMAALPVEQREVIFLKVWQQKTFAEIADLVGVGPNTAASRYRYGIEKLRRELDES